MLAEGRGLAEDERARGPAADPAERVPDADEHPGGRAIGFDHDRGSACHAAPARDRRRDVPRTAPGGERVGVDEQAAESPPARAAPVFRARAIWLTGSKTTIAPAARAISAVRSVELLSQTMSPRAHARASNAAVARGCCGASPAAAFSSLNAGTTIEIFTTLRGDSHRLLPAPGRTARRYPRCACARSRSSPAFPLRRRRGCRGCR